MQNSIRYPILIASANAGKVREIRSALAGVHIEACGLDAFPSIAEVAETGSSFAENASLKAVGYACQARMTALADDSGLEVEALGGRPGVHSARYAGAESGYDIKIKNLLAELDAVDETARHARFVCVMSLADSAGQLLYTAEGECHGTIANGPRGNGGFGYDPVFVPAGHSRTFAELDGEIKQQISHRARAIAKIIRYLRGFIDV